jgi:hypothetical protein
MSVMAMFQQLPHFPELILSHERDNAHYSSQQWDGGHNPNERVSQSMAQEHHTEHATKKNPQSN